MYGEGGGQIHAGPVVCGGSGLGIARSKLKTTLEYTIAGAARITGGTAPPVPPSIHSLRQFAIPRHGSHHNPSHMHMYTDGLGGRPLRYW